MSDVEPGTALAVVADDVRMTREPEVVLAEAQRAARALKDVIDQKPHKVMYGNEQYLEFEDWQTVGSFYNVAVKIAEDQVQHVTLGDVQGFKAHADLIRIDTGVVVGGAEAYCLTDEERWRTRPKYEWQDRQGKRERVKVGEEPVPLFQLASMAQTRAGAKALRNFLARVVVLAGYKPTPAEELETERVPRASAAVVDGRPPYVTTDTPTPSRAKVKADAVEPTGLTVVSVKAGKTGTRQSGETWTRYEVKFSDGRSASTFSDTIALNAERWLQEKRVVDPTFTKEGKYLNLSDLALVVERPTAEAEPVQSTAPPPAAAVPTHVAPPVTVHTLTRVVELPADADGKRYGVETKEFGTNQFLVTRDLALAKAAYAAFKAGDHVELDYEKQGDGRLLLALRVVRGPSVEGELLPPLERS